MTSDTCQRSYVRCAPEHEIAPGIFSTSSLQGPSVMPLLLKALDDDHTYVRSRAALGLGRLRATETRERLKVVMEQDWDQTVRSRAREALERRRE